MVLCYSIITCDDYVLLWLECRIFYEKPDSLFVSIFVESSINVHQIARKNGTEKLTQWPRFPDSVITCIDKKYPCQIYFNIQQLFDGKKYVCYTCHSKVIKGKLPCQAVVNNMYVDEIHTELSPLEKLEQILIAQWTLYEKIMVMPTGQHRKIKGATYNVPVECDQTCNQLPHPLDRPGIIMLKLKRKFRFWGHVCFQAVQPELIQQVLNWLWKYIIHYTSWY